MNQASQFSSEQNWCSDSDGGNNYFIKGTVKSYLYPNSKEDYGQTFGKTIYLMEGICKDNKYMWIQKNCGELGNYEYKGGACVEKIQQEIWYFDTYSQKLEITNSNAPFASVQGETLNDMTTYLGPSEMPQSLVSGVYLTQDKNEHNYNQYLYVGDYSYTKKDSGIIKYATNSQGKTADFLYFKHNAPLFRYKLEFTYPAMESEITDNLYLNNFLGGELTILGEKFKVVTAKRVASGMENSLKLILVSKSKTLELRDDNIEDDSFDHYLILNGKMINELPVIIRGEDNTLLVTIKEMEIPTSATDDFYVPAKGKLSKAIESENEDKKILFANKFDVEYEGLANEETHDLKVSPQTNTQYILSWYDGNSKKVEMPLAYIKEDKIVSLGKENEGKLVLKEGLIISKGDYFVVTAGNPEKGTAKSYLLQYLGATSTINVDPEIRFKELGGGEILEYQWLDFPQAIKIGGSSFAIESASDTTIDNFDILIDLDVTEKNNPIESAFYTILESEEKKLYSGDNLYVVQLIYVDNTYAKFKVNGEPTDKLQTGETYKLKDGSEISVLEVIYQSYAGGVHAATFNFKESSSNVEITNKVVLIIDNYGAKILYDEKESSSEQATFSITTPNSGAYDNQKPSEIKLGLKAVDESKVNINSFTMDGNSGTLITSVNEPTVASGYTSLGGKLTLVTPADSPAEFIYQYPEKQRLPKVKIVAYSS